MPFRFSSCRSISTIGVVTLLASGVVSAHETWLLPDDFAPPADSSVEFSMTSGMGFPALGSGIDQSRIASATLDDGQEVTNLVPSAAREGALSLSGFAADSTSCAAVLLHPRILEIKGDDRVEHYLEEIGAGSEVWDAWETASQPREWRESYSKFARTYLAGQSDEASPCWQTPSEARFDVLPMSNPTQLKAGDSLRLQLLFDGKPLANQAIGIVREGDEPGPLLRSDGSGQVVVNTSGRGRHMVYATNLRPARGDDFNWESDFVTLTFMVNPS